MACLTPKMPRSPDKSPKKVRLFMTQSIPLVYSREVPKLPNPHKEDGRRTPLNKQARRVYGPDYYLRQTRALPGELIAGDGLREIKIFEATYAEAQTTMLLCLKGLPSLKLCSICRKPGHYRRKCPDLDTVKAKNLRGE